jgi:hypothetical protein
MRYRMSVTLALWLLVASSCAQLVNTPAVSTATPAPGITFPPTYTPTLTPTRFPTLPPGPTPLPRVIPEVRLEVFSYNTFHYSPQAIYVAGAAINRGNADIGEVRIAVSLLDARGNVLVTQSLNQAHIWHVAPGGKYPFLVPLPNAPKEWKDVKIQFETKFYSPDQLHKPYWQFKIGQVAGQSPKGAYPHYGYSGSIENIGNQRARMVQVIGMAFDAGGKVIDVGENYIAFEYLNPGQDAPFQFYFNDLKTAPARYEILAEGYLTE